VRRAGSLASRISFAARAALLALCALSTASRADEPRWSFTVRAPELARGLLSVEMTLQGFPLHRPMRLCADMAGAAASVRGLRAIPAGGEPIAVPRARDDAECFDAPAPASGPLTVRYEVDLADLAHRRGDPDWAARAGDNYVFNEESVLLRPDPLPGDAPIEIAFELPEGLSVAAPWTPLDRSGRRFASSARQYDAGSYVALGHLETLAPVELDGGTFELVLLASPHRASSAALREWVARAARAVGAFYRGVPGGRALVLLAPVAGVDEPGVFGSTLHRAAPSLVLFFGADAADAKFDHDWMAVHELFHVGNPRLSGKVRWFAEGSATYYQDVLRGRASMEKPEMIWSDLYDGFRRFCDAEVAPGKDGRAPRSLGEESEELRKLHHYTRVYWGGACLFFRADVAIRERSGGQQSLDDVLRALLARSMEAPLDEDELVAALDEAAGSPLAREQLDTKRPIAMDALYRKLGLEPVASDRVRLNERAPESALRRAILEERAGATTSRPRSSETPR